MFKATDFHDLVSGRKRGLGAGLLRSVLWLAAIPYGLVIRWRNRRYDKGQSEVHRVAVPVVSVGNLTLGGTGKTPMVEWIARWFRERGIRVTLISRGYGAEAGSVNDEALELELKLPDVPHLQNPDRVSAAQTAIEELDCQVIVLDDAFQHRRLGRELDIVLLDSQEPFGLGHLFPRGTLREPVSGLERADVVVLSRADMIATDERLRIRDEVLRLTPHAAWAEVRHAPKVLLNSTGEQQPLETLRDKPVALFSGIGNPAGFRHTVLTCGYRVIAMREFADHYRYGRDDVESLTRWADGLDVAAVLCTHKDLVKLDLDRLGPRPLWAVSVGLEYLSGQEQVEARLQGLLGQD